MHLVAAVVVTVAAADIAEQPGGFLCPGRKFRNLTDVLGLF